jgi:peptidyl-prolyl cis-trans isomerase SurA
MKISRQLTRLLTLTMLLPGLASAQSTASTRRADPVEISSIVAVVNDEAITSLELKARLATVKQQLRSQNVQLPADSVLEKQMLERMITDRVQLQQAKETGLRISDIEVDGAMRRIAANNRMSLEEFRSAIERDGIRWPKFREDIREEMTIARLRERDVDGRIVITDGEVDNYLANPAAGLSANTEVRISHIILRLPEQATPDQLMRIGVRAQDARTQILNGESFAKVAAGFSDAPDALSGGDMGARPVNRLPNIYAEAVMKLKPGEVSDILRSPAGFHIIKLVEQAGVKEVAAAAVKQTLARHILIKTTEIVTAEEALRTISGIKDRLNGGADFAEMAKQFSNDLSSTKGGDLGWLFQGDTVPEFEKAMDALKLNEISGPVRSPFGYHLIQVQERRTQDATEDRKRQAARQVLRERKSDEAYQEWLRQQRDKAYVEYRTGER